MRKPPGPSRTASACGPESQRSCNRQGTPVGIAVAASRPARELKHRGSVALLLLCCSAAFAQDPLGGVWSDESLTLRLDGEGEAYSGTIEFDGRTFPTQATYDGASLDGSFESDGDEFFFQGRLDGELLVFETGGATYRLTRLEAKTKPVNPLGARAAVEPPSSGKPTPADKPTVGPYRLELPQGWSSKPDPQAGVALIPPRAAPDNQEVYAITHLPGVTGPEDPRAAAVLQQMLGAAAMAATYRLEELTAGGRTVVLHAFGLPDVKRRLHAYLSLSNGQTLAVMASGLDAVVEPREAVIREIAGTAMFVGQPAPAPVSQAPSRGAPTVGHIQTHPDAPPIQPGQLSDGEPQSLQWLQHLNGKLLTVMESYSGGAAGGYWSSNRTLLLPNGRFQDTSSSSVSADVGGAGGHSGGQETLTGTWRIISANGSSFLAVVADGARQEFYLQLNMQGGQTFVDGKRVFVTVPK